MLITSKNNKGYAPNAKLLHIDNVCQIYNLTVKGKTNDKIAYLAKC